MKKQRQVKKLAVLAAVFLITGCIQTSIIDDVALIGAAALDRTENDNIKLTVSYPTFLEQGQEKILESEQIAAVAKTLKGARELLNGSSQRPLKFGQIRVLLFSDALSESGVEPYVDSMYRDPSIGNRVLLAVVDGEAQDALMIRLGAGERPDVFLGDLLLHNMEEHLLPSTNLHVFMFSALNDARDPYLPLLLVKDDKLRIGGTALFKRDRFVDNIGIEDSFFLKLMVDEMKQTTHQFQIDEDGEKTYVMVEKIFSSFNREMTGSMEAPHFRCHIHFRGEITDYTGPLTLTKDETMNKIEEGMARQIATKGEELLKRFQSLGIDPVGLGEKYRSHTRDWKPEVWHDSIYEQATVEVTAEVEIVQSGITE